MPVQQQQRGTVAAGQPDNVDAAGVDAKLREVGETHSVRSCLLSLFERFVL
jgi:hypothetical protein